MAVLLITYDLKKEQSKTDYNGFYDFIKKHPWARLSESSYAIETNFSPQMVYNSLLPFIDKNDWILVITLKKPYFGQHDSPVIKWLDSRLTF